MKQFYAVPVSTATRGLDMDEFFIVPVEAVNFKQMYKEALEAVSLFPRWDVLTSVVSGIVVRWYPQVEFEENEEYRIITLTDKEYSDMLFRALSDDESVDAEVWPETGTLYFTATGKGEWADLYESSPITLR